MCNLYFCDSVAVCIDNKYFHLRPSSVWQLNVWARSCWQTVHYAAIPMCPEIWAELSPQPPISRYLIISDRNIWRLPAGQFHFWITFGYELNTVYCSSNYYLGYGVLGIMECVYLVFVKVCLVFVYSILEQDLAERELRARGPLGKCFNDGTLGFQTASFPMVDFHLFRSMRFGEPKLVVIIDYYPLINSGFNNQVKCCPLSDWLL